MKKLFLPLMLSSSTAIAAPFTTLDARSMAMGDTGVASSKPGSAPQFNPALLSNYSNNERVSIILPNIGVAAFADPDAVDSLFNIQDEDYIGNLSDALDSLNTTITNVGNGTPNAGQISRFRSDLNDFTRNASGLTSDLNKLSEKPYNVNANAIFSVAIPNSFLGFAVYAGVDSLVLETRPIISACDSQILNNYIDRVDGLANLSDPTNIQQIANPIIEYACGGQPTETFNIIDGNRFNDPTSELQSSVEIAGVGIAELGVSLAHEFSFGDQDVSIGITPKYQQITSTYANPSVQDIDDGTFKLGDALDENRKENSAFNLDIGIAMSFLPDESLTWGLIAKNLVPYTFETATYTPARGPSTSAEYNVNPQVRTGISWAAPLGITLTSDIDLTRNEPYFSGPDTQYWGAGVEFDIFNVLRLRGGYRTNLADSRDQVLTAGMGLNILVVHFDIGAQYSDNNAGAAFQMGIEF
ncbi:Uncharacterised protein [BD1-7 clade bacterium]|uniref:Conjugal transfer protein TraF n=1 Tax=BD1-7 clade bacterium TaxID=2029982 RepID=A0A5S9MU52_9GAMM|nr:Uncharacterised protein [BD1-7 clade bacterium]